MSKLSDLFGLNEKDGEAKKNKLGWMLVIGGIGVCLLILSSFLKRPEEDAIPRSWFPAQQTTNDQKPTSQTMTIEDYEHQYEQQLSDVLSKISGVDDVSVIVNLDSTEEDVVQYDERDSVQTTNETDLKGGTRSIQQNNTERKTTMYRNDQGEQPLVIKKLKPKVRGVLVVARGVEDLRIKAMVIEAIQRTLDVPKHRIAVFPKG